MESLTSAKFRLLFKIYLIKIMKIIFQNFIDLEMTIFCGVMNAFATIKALNFFDRNLIYLNFRIYSFYKSNLILCSNRELHSLLFFYIIKFNN